MDTKHVFSLVIYFLLNIILLFKVIHSRVILTEIHVNVCIFENEIHFKVRGTTFLHPRSKCQWYGVFRSNKCPVFAFHCLVCARQKRGFEPTKKLSNEKLPY